MALRIESGSLLVVSGSLANHADCCCNPPCDAFSVGACECLENDTQTAPSPLPLVSVNLTISITAADHQDLIGSTPAYSCPSFDGTYVLDCGVRCFVAKTFVTTVGATDYYIISSLFLQKVGIFVEATYKSHGFGSPTGTVAFHGVEERAEGECLGLGFATHGYIAFDRPASNINHCGFFSARACNEIWSEYDNTTAGLYNCRCTAIAGTCIDV